MKKSFWTQTNIEPERLNVIYEIILILLWNFHLFYRTVDTEKFFLAVRLGSRHGVSLEEVAVRHLTSLLLSSDGIQQSELMAQLANPRLAQLLKTSPQFVCDR
jgi:hypothetical protein